MKYLFAIVILFILHSTPANSQEYNFTCENDAYKYLENILGHWYVETKDRTSPNVYESNSGMSIISNSIEGCGIKESYRGMYRGREYAREVTIAGMDSLQVQMATLDSEHGGFSIHNGSIVNETMTTYWYRNEDVKKLQSKYIMTQEDEDSFEFSSYLSTDYGNTWALTHGRKYSRIHAKEVSLTTKDSVTVFGDVYTIDKSYPTILLFHQGGSNAKGEYSSIIPKLQKEGFNVMAIDQRIGGSAYYGGYNRTVSKLKPNTFTYCDALPDLEAALDYLIENNYNGKRILWGSSYSAALAIQMTSKRQEVINALLAFSPSTGNAVKSCHPNPFLDKISIPLLLLRPKKEMERESSVEQANIAKKFKHQVYIAEYGTHGSSMLVEERVGNMVDENWKIVMAFLSKFK